MFEKSTKISVTYREKGNEAYKKNDLYHALVFYNKALSFAHVKQDIGLAYANRSAVYFQLKNYEDCIKNIKWAQKNGYPNEKMKNLLEREEKCKKFMQELGADVKKDPWHFFKLSYQQNPRVPFIIGNLALKKDSKYGRGIYTFMDLNPGDVIAIETPVLSILCDNDDARYKHCCNCLKSSMLNLLPCKKSGGLMFCSSECRENTYRLTQEPLNMIPKGTVVSGERLVAYGREAIGNDVKLMEFMKDYKVKDDEKTIFDYDLSQPKSKYYKKNLLSCVLGLQFDRYSKKHELKNSDQTGGLIKFMNQLAAIIDLNSLGIQCLDASKSNYSSPKLSLHGLSLLVFGSLLNHSCDPNIQRIYVDGKFVFVVCKPIKSKEQLFINYAADFYNNSDVGERRKKLSKFSFKCTCDACIFFWTREKLIQPYNDFKSPLKRALPKKLEDCFKEMEDNNKYIKHRFFNLHTLPIHETIQRNFDLLAYTAYLMSFSR